MTSSHSSRPSSKKAIRNIQKADKAPWRRPLSAVIRKYYKSNRRQWPTRFRREFVATIPSIEIKWGIRPIHPSDHPLCRLKRTSDGELATRPSFASLLLLLFLFPKKQLKQNAIWRYWKEDWAKYSMGRLPSLVPEFHQHVLQHNANLREKREQDPDNLHIDSDMESFVTYSSNVEDELLMDPEGNYECSSIDDSGSESEVSDSAPRQATTRSRPGEQQSLSDDRKEEGYRSTDAKNDTLINKPVEQRAFPSVGISPKEEGSDLTNVRDGETIPGHKLKTDSLIVKKVVKAEHIDDDIFYLQVERGTTRRGRLDEQDTLLTSRSAWEAAVMKQDLETNAKSIEHFRPSEPKDNLNGNSRDAVEGQSRLQREEKSVHGKASPVSQDRPSSDSAFPAQNSAVSRQQGITMVDNREKGEDIRRKTPSSNNHEALAAPVSLRDQTTLMGIMFQPNTLGAAYRRLLLSASKIKGDDAQRDFVLGIAGLSESYLRGERL